MKHIGYRILFLLTGSIIIAGYYSCTKAGLGGEAAIVAFPKHHDLSIPGCIIYIKYDTEEFPGEDVSVYDDMEAAEEHTGQDPHVHFENLKKGKYYLYGIGFDSSINAVVKGGIPFPINDKNGEFEVIIPVTED